MFSLPPRQKPWLSWLFAALWALFIFIAVPLARDIQAIIAQYWGQEIYTWLVAAAVLLGLTAAVLIVRKQNPRSPKRLVWLAGVAAAYLAYTMALAAGHPVEAVHFVEYGILSLLVFQALAHRVRDYGIYLSAALICGMAGIVDEVIQWITPERYWDIRDIWMNFFAAAMAQTALALGLRPNYIKGWPDAKSKRLLYGLVGASLFLMALNLIFILPESRV